MPEVTTVASFDTFAKLFSGLLAAFPGEQTDPATGSQVFFLALQDIPDDALAFAVAEWLARGRKFPTIADLRELALSDEYPLPEEAWGEVKRAFAQYGRSQEPQFSHPIISQVVDDFGWESLCSSNVQDEPIVRAQFVKAYRARVRRATFDSTSLARGLRSLKPLEASITDADFPGGEE